MQAKEKQENGSPLPRLQAREEETASSSVERDDLKVCLPAAAVFGCLGCVRIDPPGHCYFGNEPGDEYCQRDRKLNLRATAECERRGCISAIHVENHTLVCSHNEDRCECLDRDGNSHGFLTKAKPIPDVIDAEKAQVERLLAQGRVYQRTGNPKAFSGPPVVVGS